MHVWCFIFGGWLSGCWSPAPSRPLQPTTPHRLESSVDPTSPACMLGLANPLRSSRLPFRFLASSKPIDYPSHPDKNSLVSSHHPFAISFSLLFPFRRTLFSWPLRPYMRDTTVLFVPCQDNCYHQYHSTFDNNTNIPPQKAFTRLTKCLSPKYWLVGQRNASSRLSAGVRTGGGLVHSYRHRRTRRFRTTRLRILTRSLAANSSSDST